jgi:predicted metal-binding membrane protein
MSAMLLTWRRERNVIMMLLVVLAALAWAVLLWSPVARPGRGAMGLTMGMTAAVFVSIWVVMMVAMMFPAAAPMILTFARVHASKREQGRAFVPTGVFVSSYLLVWAVFGAAAYGLASLADSGARQVPWLMVNGPRIGGVLLVAAGLYQLSPLKQVCLSKCRAPLGFILHSWRDGYAGSFRMGLGHAGYCVGCCWLLMVILFPLGVMNMAAMAAITALIFTEKSLRVGIWLARLAAAALIGFGAAVVVLPDLLPATLMGTAGM